MIYHQHDGGRVPVREAILHCAAIKTGQFAGWSARQVFCEINRWHIQRGFLNGFGYHGLFMPDGTFYPGRPFDKMGAHVIGRNLGTLGFLLIESREVENVADDPLEWFKQDQLEEVGRFLRRIDGLEKVSGHNDYGRKLCPGFRVHTEDWL